MPGLRRCLGFDCFFHMECVCRGVGWEEMEEGREKDREPGDGRRCGWCVSARHVSERPIYAFCGVCRPLPSPPLPSRCEARVEQLPISLCGLYSSLSVGDPRGYSAKQTQPFHRNLHRATSCRVLPPPSSGTIESDLGDYLNTTDIYAAIFRR